MIAGHDLANDIFSGKDFFKIVEEDLNDEFVKRMVEKEGTEVQEGMVFELKGDQPQRSDIDDQSIPATTAAFANTYGGWLIVGIEQTGDICGDGFKVPGNAEVDKWVNDVIMEQVDPTPAHLARSVPYQGSEVLLVRVFASDDTPHVLKRSGNVYIRKGSSKQSLRKLNKAIGTKHELVELYQRGDAGREHAEKILGGELPYIRESLSMHTRKAVLNNAHVRDGQRITFQDEQQLRVVLAPVTLNSQFRERALSEPCHKELKTAAAALLDPQGESREIIRLESGQYGLSATTESGNTHAEIGHKKHCVVAVDAGGAIGTKVTWTPIIDAIEGDDYNVTSIHEYLYSDGLTEAITALTKMLNGELLQVYGRCLVEAAICPVSDRRYSLDPPGKRQGKFRQHWSGYDTVGGTQQKIVEGRRLASLLKSELLGITGVGGDALDVEDSVSATAELMLPIDANDIGSVSQGLLRQFRRAAGEQAYEAPTGIGEQDEMSDKSQTAA